MLTSARFLLIWLVAGSLGDGRANAAADADARREAAQRRRRIIFNNDGNDAVYFPKQLAPTDENFLSLRTTPLLTTQVDTISYCTNRGIGLVTHRSKENQMLYAETREAAGAYADKHNIVRQLHERRTDPLAIMVRFCRENGKEIFWSMRMNDIHDAGNDAMLPEFKRANPQVLFGSKESPPPFRGYSGLWNEQSGMKWGGYSGVDYGKAEVRDLVFRTVEEVCRNYDIDGVELDFFRSPVLFRSQAWLQPVSDEEREALTGLLRRIRTAADELGRKRGRPFLLSVRVPDSEEYCRSIGINLEQWLSEKLINLLIPGGDFVLMPWGASVRLGRQFGVPVYPCITRAPTSANPGYEGRSAPECYRARAQGAWAAGADGIHMFNIFDPGLAALREIGDPATLQGKSKVYYGSELPTRHAQTYHASWRRFRMLPTLSPEHPEGIGHGSRFTTSIEVPENFAANATQPRAVLGLCFATNASEPAPAEVMFNGTLLKPTGHGQKGWSEYEVPLAAITTGANEVSVEHRATLTLTDLRVSIIYPESRPR